MADCRALPRVDSLSQSALLAQYPRDLRIMASRVALQTLRSQPELPANLQQAAEELAIKEARRCSAPSLRRIINASGVILHTGAGRARLAKQAAAQLAEVAAHHSNVEVDLDTGKRGDRQFHVRALLREQTGAEDALVVNNCAAAVFLALHALANRKEVILSRGQMVEIGGSFRLPEIVRQSGCKLVEVGATNKARIEDYANAITPRTAMILRCHPSNYRVVGFTQEAALGDLSNLCKETGVLLMDDVGSGCIVDTSRLGLAYEPRMQDSLAAGSDIVTASADKMLGASQAGLILGRKALIDRLRKHPLARVVRIDKLSLAALEATLRLYSVGMPEEIPTLYYLTRPVEELHAVAERLQQAYRGEAIIADGITEVGGGSLPGVGIPTVRVGLRAKHPMALGKALRQAEPPILTRVEDDLVWIDPRTMDLAEVSIVQSILEGLA